MRLLRRFGSAVFVLTMLLPCLTSQRVEGARLPSLLQSQFVLNPPLFVVWAKLETKAPHAQERVRILAIEASTVVAEDLPEAQRAEWKEQARNLAFYYPKAVPREKLRWVWETFKMARQHGVFRRFRGLWVHGRQADAHLAQVSFPGGQEISVLRDDMSGEYVAVVTRVHDSKAFGALVASFSGDEQPPAKIVNRVAESTEVFVEVNGFRMYVASAGEDAVTEAVEALWGGLSPRAKEHISRLSQMALSVGPGRAKKQAGAFSLPLSLPFAIRVLAPENRVPLELAVTDGQGSPRFELPPDAVLKEFFGKRSAPIPDLTRPFPKVAGHLY